MDRITRIFLCISLGWLTVFGVPKASAATRETAFRSPVGVVRVGDLVSIDVVMTNLDQAINAADVTIVYPADRLEVVSLSRAQSAMTLWPEPPRWDNASGRVHVVGGLPNGLFAKDARLVTLLMKALATGPAPVTLDTQASGFYLNDGAGSKALLPASSMILDVVSDFTPVIRVSSTTHPEPNQWYPLSTVTLTWDRTPATQYSYAWSPDGQTVPDDIPEKDVAELTFSDLPDGRYSFAIKSRPEGGSWSAVTQRWFLIDRTAPEALTIEQLPPQSVDGRTVVSWSAVDAMSGAVSTLRVGSRELGEVQSPLTIDPSWLGKVLRVTVADMAGNISSATWNHQSTTGTMWDWRSIGAVIGLLLLGGVVLRIFRRRR